MNDKILILGDIHGRIIWQDIINKENPDKIVFLGDYVTTHENISSKQQCSNLEDILNYKENNPDKVILLRGNHDLQSLGYSWAECSGYDRVVSKYMSDIKDRFLQLTQYIYVIPNTNILCSHAGISFDWLKSVEVYLFKDNSQYDDGSTDLDIIINKINTIEPCELFGFTPNHINDFTGDSTTQPCTWIRPYTLLYSGIKEYVHVVGHTPIKHICNLKDECIKAREKYSLKDNEDVINEYCDIWACDCLSNKEYLIYQNNKLTPSSL